MDEESIHAHFHLDAYDRSGTALSDKVKRSHLRELQDITFAVMSLHAPGIERGRSKIDRVKAGALPADVTHKSPRVMRERLPLEIAALKRERADLTRQVAELQVKFAKNVSRAEEAQKKAERMEKNAAKGERALKNAAT